MFSVTAVGSGPITADREPHRKVGIDRTRLTERNGQRLGSPWARRRPGNDLK